MASFCRFRLSIQAWRCVGDVFESVSEIVVFFVDLLTIKILSALVGSFLPSKTPVISLLLFLHRFLCSLLQWQVRALQVDEAGVGGPRIGGITQRQYQQSYLSIDRLNCNVEVFLQYEASSSVLIGDVDCTVHSDVCSKHGVSGYPTIKYYKVSYLYIYICISIYVHM